MDAAEYGLTTVDPEFAELRRQAAKKRRDDAAFLESIQMYNSAPKLDMEDVVMNRGGRGRWRTIETLIAEARAAQDAERRSREEIGELVEIPEPIF